MTKIHSDHQGIVRCRVCAATSVWWPGSARDMEEFIQSCPECQRTRHPVRNHCFLLILNFLHTLGRGLHQTCLCWGNPINILVADYFSRYVEVQHLTSTTAVNIISALKSIFSQHGVPAVMVSDNGPHYDCAEMKRFAERYSFKHITSSPYHPQLNGLAERMVNTVQQLLQDSADPHIALMSYRTTPLPAYGLSPAELLMGQKIRTDVPQLPKTFIPEWKYLQKFKETDRKQKEKQKHDFNNDTGPSLYRLCLQIFWYG